MTTKTFDWNTDLYSYRFTLVMDKIPASVLPPDEILLAMAQKSARDLSITPDNVESLNNGATWAFMECAAL